MTRPASTPLTPEITREVCLRNDGKAYVVGSIATLGNEYVLGLNAINCQNGDTLAQEQVTAATKEKVLTALGDAAVRLRGELGETRSTVKKFDVPLEQATTSSLEALKAYSRGIRAGRSEGDMAALPLLKRAVEMDLNFALAYAQLGLVYSDLGEIALSADFASKAFTLRDRASEWELFSIDSTYYRSVTGQLEKAEEVSLEWKQTYPQDPAPYVQLGLIYSSLGRLEPALENDLEALKLRKYSGLMYGNVAYDYLYLDELDDAEGILHQARGTKLDETLLPNFYQLAFLRQDDKDMKRSFSAALGKPGEEDALLSSQADTEAFHGRIRKARELSQRAVDSAIRAGQGNSSGLAGDRCFAGGGIRKCSRSQATGYNCSYTRSQSRRASGRRFGAGPHWPGWPGEHNRGEATGQFPLRHHSGELLDALYPCSHRSLSRRRPSGNDIPGGDCPLRTGSGSTTILVRRIVVSCIPSRSGILGKSAVGSGGRRVSKDTRPSWIGLELPAWRFGPPTTCARLCGFQQHDEGG